MNIGELDSVRLVPFFMQEDASVRGICAAMDYILNYLTECLKRSSIYTNLNYMEESDLDYIAQADGIFWYDSSDDKQSKINILKNNRKMFRLLGTIYAVEQLLQDITDENTHISEWFEYKGDPFLFKIITNQPLTDDLLRCYYDRIDKVKNVRSQLHGIESYRDLGNAKIYYGAGNFSYTKNVLIPENLEV